MISALEQLFPGLVGGGYRVTSLPDRDYNCIAWAVGDSHNWWWPGRDLDKEYWPPGVPRERTLAAFVAAFASVGHAVCEGEGPEAGYERIALFADADGKPTHAARQRPNGRWSSKLGKAEDIEQQLHDLKGALYGSVVLITKKKVSGIFPSIRE
jgi:hypothetical protein